MTTLLAANDGGHLRQLYELQARLPISDDCLWVTVPTPQTESLLRDEDVYWISPAPTRDIAAAARNAIAVRRLFTRYAISNAFSTGSSVAVSVLPQAGMRGIPATYIESVTRAESLSLSARLLQFAPGVNICVQWPHLASRRHHYCGSVLDGLEAKSVERRSIRRLVVSVGTQRFAFPRLLGRLASVIPHGVEVLWQTGSADVSDLLIEPRATVPAAELEAAIQAADAVVAHAGAGIALTALRNGKIPVLVPREPTHKEHVDDHQQQIARALGARELAIVADADEVSWAHIEAASTMTCVRAGPVPILDLGERR